MGLNLVAVECVRGIRFQSLHDRPCFCDYLAKGKGRASRPTTDGGKSGQDHVRREVGTIRLAPPMEAGDSIGLIGDSRD